MEPLLASAVVAALVSAVVGLLSSERRVAAENVIQERKNWRDKIRALSLEVHGMLVSAEEGSDAKLRSLHGQFFLLVNPHDTLDQAILRLISKRDPARAEEFIQRVALLLKHDWERAKREASLWRSITERPPARVRFENYTPGDEYKYPKCWWG